MADADFPKAAGGDAAMYEGELPYVFISYSHRDASRMIAIRNFLRRSGIRYWYDSGLHSGDDWNLVIARHLERAAVCLLLLSKNSVASQYVKNELNFALNHRIPLHAVQLEAMELPIDVEMMIGRIQILDGGEGFEHRLLESLPGELCGEAPRAEEAKRAAHPLYQMGEEVMNRQGTSSHLGSHRTLEYPLLIQEESIANVGADAALKQAKLASRLNHPLFPRIFDITIDGEWMRTYQEYRGEVFLDDYLRDHQLSEAKIAQWLGDVINGMEYLFSRNLGLRDFARGSLVVLEGERIGMFRLQNSYYGALPLRAENRQYYFEREFQEIAVLLHQLCTGAVPTMPIGMIESDRLGRGFVNKANLIIQKCAKLHGRTRYESFRQIREELNAPGIGVRDAVFLRQRRAKLEQYERARQENMNRFTGGEEVEPRSDNLEEQFGLEATVTLSQSEGPEAPKPAAAEEPLITIMICETGQVLRFYKPEIVIGRGAECDVVLNQPMLSRRHAQIRRLDREHYKVRDLNTSNGIGLAPHNLALSISDKIQRDGSALVSRGEIIQIGGVKLQLR